MKVSDLKKFLENMDENLEICILKNGGQGYGDLPVSINPKIEYVTTFGNKQKRVLLFN